MSGTLEHSFNVEAKSFFPPYYKDVGDHLSYLFQNPEALDEVLESLFELFSAYADDEEMMDRMVLCLVNQLIENDNIQYIGSLCCIHLFNCISSTDNKSTFKTSLIKRLNKTHKHLEGTGHKDHEAFNFLYLLTEFSMHLELDFLAKFIISIISNIVEHKPTLDSFKCVHKVIKMSRLTLCKQEPGEFDELHSRLKKIIINDSTSEEDRRHLLNIVILMTVCKTSSATMHSSQQDSSGVSQEFDSLSVGKKKSEEHVSYGVTFFNDTVDTFILPNEVAYPEIFHDYVNFTEGLEDLDEQAEQALEGFLAGVEKKQTRSE